MTELESGNSRTVFVINADGTKDLSEARKFGKLRAVFENPRKPYDTAKLIAQARFVLQNFEEGDYLLIIGDPTLCAVAMSILLESHGKVNVLSWDRRYFTYAKQEWDFDLDEYEEDPFNKV